MCMYLCVCACVRMCVFVCACVSVCERERVCVQGLGFGLMGLHEDRFDFLRHDHHAEALFLGGD